MRFPRIFLDFNTGVVHFLVLPVFLISFIILYTPLGMIDFLTLHTGSFVFNVTIVTCITLMTLVITRLLLSILRRTFTPSWALYFFIVFWEMMVIVAFISLYLHLMDKVIFPTYFDCYFKCLPKFMAIFIYPYIILTLFFALRGSLEEREQFQDQTQSRVKFYDYRHNLKCTIDSSELLYIESKDNYVVIHYTKNDLLTSVTLRTSMKSIEEICRKNGLVRCHRSYYVKVSRIKALLRGKEGYIAAQMNDLHASEVAVSKKYYDSLTSLL